MKETFLLIPEEVLKTINEKQDKILELLSNQKGSTTTDFITEREAKEIFKRKATWFWQMRKNGILPFSKIGKSIYYSVKDLKKLMEDSKSEILVTSK